MPRLDGGAHLTCVTCVCGSVCVCRQQPDRRTADQGGKASASDFVKYVIEELHKLQFGGLPKIKAT